MNPQYYNEFDPYAAEWLRNLIAAGHLPAGDVDERSILDVQPEDLNGYEQCHWFAGIGVWPYALGRIGWARRANLWSGSCPCQPFSAAGRQLGFNDERHLWPAWFHLITQRRPSIVVGEQVSSALAWLDLVSHDLESAGYAVGAADLCAAGFPVENWSETPHHERLLRALYDCPDPVVAAELLDFAMFASRELGAHDGDHIRSRAYFVGVADGDDGRCEIVGGVGVRGKSIHDAYGRGDDSGLAAANGGNPRAERQQRGGEQRFQSEDHGPSGGRGGGARAGTVGGVGDAGSARTGRDAGAAPSAQAGGGNAPVAASAANRADAPHRSGSAADWLFCRDGKWRAVGPGAFPLANAPPARVGRLRAYGNALDGQTVEAFLASVRECLP